MKIRICIISIFFISLFSSCKLKSLIPDSEFAQQENLLENINGVYALDQHEDDSLETDYMRYQRRNFHISDIVKKKDRSLLNDKHFEKLEILYDGKKKVTFCLFDGTEKMEFTYKCKRKENYLEVYFTKRRIWALPLFMNYEYDRLRLGVDKDSNLIIHKWHTVLATLTIMPFDYFGNIDCSQKFTKISP